VNFSTLFKAYDTVMALREAARKFTAPGPPGPPETSLSQTAAAQGLAGQIETRLTNVVVAALKEAFDRDHARLERHLGAKLLEREIVIDAVEGETYYVYLDDAGLDESRRFLSALCRVHGLDENAVLASINAVCAQSFATIEAALAEHAVSLVKVPLAGGEVKLYARPFLRGWRFPLDQQATRFLCRLHACAESDLKQATELARRMVGLWGMSEALGPVSYGVGEQQPFLGRELAAPREFAEATAARIDAEVAGLIAAAHDRARATLSRNRAALDALAAELVAHESVTARRLDEILVAAGAKLPSEPTGSAAAPHVERPKTAAKPRVAAARAVRRLRRGAGTEPPPG